MTHSLTISCSLGLVTLAAVLGAVTLTAISQSATSGPAVGKLLLTCSDCHLSAAPTRDKPELVPCPRHAVSTGPAVVLLDQLSDQYVPVVFAHQLHAEMTEMTGGCVLCHHHNPNGVALPCRECHGSNSTPLTLEHPGLRGAYHRQCLNCHREWSHKTDCAVCHAKKTADSVPIQVPDPTDIMGVLHPNVEEPELVLYDTDSEEGSKVVFRHQDHIHRFGFGCVRCHREESCSRCHNEEKNVTTPMSLEQHHRPCSSCHLTTEPDPGVSGVEKACGHCHANQALPPFNHATTGLTLNEDHADWDCTECHRDAQYNEPPSCVECHEADFTFPEKSPGKQEEDAP